MVALECSKSLPTRALSMSDPQRKRRYQPLQNGFPNLSTDNNGNNVLDNNPTLRSIV